VATVYMELYSDLSYVHLPIDKTGSELLKSKIAFENYAMRQGIHKQHYHADDGRFADSSFLKKQPPGLVLDYGILRSQCSSPEWKR